MKNDLTNCACLNLRKTARMVAQFYDQRLLPSGLRATQFSLLAMLDGVGPISITHLADQMGMDRTTLTRNIKLLERDGLSTWEAGEKDARVRMLSLTKKGRQAMQKTLPYWEVAQADFLEKYGTRRWQNLSVELVAANTILAPE